MINGAGFRELLTALGLTQVEAARLLAVDPRTVRRWLDGGERIPGPAEQALRAWCRLHQRGLAWRPPEDAHAIHETLAEGEALAIAQYREHMTNLRGAIARVRASGGPATQWDVDLVRGRASFKGHRLYFSRLPDGRFAPQSYRGAPEGDGEGAPVPRTLLEDAYACIARALDRAGSPMRSRLVFSPPALEPGRLVLWEQTQTPALVAVIACQALREALQVDTADADLQRIVDAGLDAVTELAEAAYAARRFTTRDLGLRVIDLDEGDLRSIESRLTLRLAPPTQPIAAAGTAADASGSSGSGSSAARAASDAAGSGAEERHAPASRSTSGVGW